MLNEIQSFFGGRAQPMMAQIAEAGFEVTAEAGKLTLDDVCELERTIRRHERAEDSDKNGGPQ
jgi:hypothetical protein